MTFLKPTCNFIFISSKLILQLKKDAPIVGLACSKFPKYRPIKLVLPTPENGIMIRVLITFMNDSLMLALILDNIHRTSFYIQKKSILLSNSASISGYV